jgi:hypothetical protein
MPFAHPLRTRAAGCAPALGPAAYRLGRLTGEAWLGDA